MNSISPHAIAAVHPDDMTDPQVAEESQKTGLSDEQFEQLLADEITDALSYIGSDIAPRREELLRYYNFDMSQSLPSLVGRSSVVDGTVAAQIGLMMPSLMKIMCGGPNFWTYDGWGEDDKAQARAATDFVNNIVMRQDNNGELIIHDWLKDGLTQITGVLKIWWEEKYDYQTQTITVPELMLPQVMQELAAHPDRRLVGQESQTVGLAVPNGPQIGTTIYNLAIQTRIDKSHVCIWPVPPEEWVISRDARSESDGAVLRSHRTLRKVGDLLAEGYPEDIVLSLPNYDDLDWDGERLNREQLAWNPAPDRDVDPMLREVVVHQGIIKCDRDGSGIKDWYFVAGGSTASVKLMQIEEYADQVHFADWCPNPSPHTYFGRCPADDLVPIQKTKTTVLRQTMDNMYLSLSPQRLVNLELFGKGGIESLMNMRPGGPVPVKDVTMAVQDISVPFFADKSFGMLSYFDDEAEKRSGVNRASMGLDPDVLQGQSATATALAATAAQGKMEMIAKIFAVGGMRKLARGVLKILKRYQAFTRDVRINGKQVKINPQDWATFEDWEATINTGLGTGTREKDAQLLAFIMSKQEQALAQGGPSNGVVTPGQYTAAFTDFIQASGLKDPERYVTPLDPKMVPPPPPPPGPSPDASLLADVEKEKIDAADAQKAAELSVKKEIETYKVDEQEKTARLKIVMDTWATLRGQGIDLDIETLKARAKAGS